MFLRFSGYGYFSIGNYPRIWTVGVKSIYPRHSCGMFDASTSMVDRHNANRLTALVSIFEEHFSRKAPATQTDNHIKDTVIIFGHVARHLDSTDCCIPDIVDRLFEARKALPDLSPLVKLMRPRLPSLVGSLMEDLLNTPKCATWCGASYGLAGALKGTGIAGIKHAKLYQTIPSQRNVLVGVAHLVQ